MCFKDYRNEFLLNICSICMRRHCYLFHSYPSSYWNVCTRETVDVLKWEEFPNETRHLEVEVWFLGASRVPFWKWILAGKSFQLNCCGRCIGLQFSSAIIAAIPLKRLGDDDSDDWDDSFRAHILIVKCSFFSINVYVLIYVNVFVCRNELYSQYRYQYQY